MRPFIATGLLVLTALLMVFFNQLEWIPLFVRYLVLFTLIVGTVILFLASTGWVPTKALFRVVASFLLIAAISGMITSARHIWIQGLPPDQVPACAPPLSFMVEIEGLWRAMQQTFLAGTADCHDSTWRFLGLSMPMWVLINFLGLGLIGFARNFFGFEQREAAR
jgi:disulfide bond formation protein DsbB